MILRTNIGIPSVRKSMPNLSNEQGNPSEFHASIPQFPSRVAVSSTLILHGELLCKTCTVPQLILVLNRCTFEKVSSYRLLDRMKGLVFNIQRFSVHDGPGIRTTVFLKGCPLRCKWCHNPESLSTDPELMLRNDRCIRCGDCATLCKNNAIERVDGGFATQREVCIDCGECIEVCDADARALIGKEMTTEEVIAEIEKDVVFYDQSGGGASFSGGEPLLQHEFLISLLERCKRKNIHTVVDTAGLTTSTILDAVSAHVDLFLFDLKTTDDAMHRKFTGVSNIQILSNLRRLADQQKKVIVRIPLIPGVNDARNDIKRAGEFVGGLGNVSEIHLLPYHPAGTEKYVRLGKEYEMGTIVPPSADDLSSYMKELRQYVSSVSIGG